MDKTLEYFATDESNNAVLPRSNNGIGFFSAFMIGVYSYSIHYPDESINVPLYSTWIHLPSKLPVALYCIEFIFSCLLIYGSHKKSIIFLKTYYYFAITTTVAALVLQVLAMSYNAGIAEYFVELALFSFTGLCIQLYLITLIRSLLKKLEMSGPHVYENQLQQFAYGEMKIESNGIYNNSTVVLINA